MDSLIDVFLPRRCLGCKELISRKIFCNPCAEMIHSVTHGGIDTTLISAAFIFGGPLRDLILRAKFQPDESISRLLARHLQSHLITQGQLLPNLAKQRYDYVTYVPSHWRRRFSRGHDLPSIFASSIAKQIETPLKHMLYCARYDPPLSATRSTSEREVSLQGRYKLSQPDLPPAEILLVDDVTTTGLTLTKSAIVLQEPGHKVHCFAFAKTLLTHKPPQFNQTT